MSPKLMLWDEFCCVDFFRRNHLHVGSSFQANVPKRPSAARLDRIRTFLFPIWRRGLHCSNSQFHVFVFNKENTHIQHSKQVRGQILIGKRVFFGKSVVSTTCHNTSDAPKPLFASRSTLTQKTHFILGTVDGSEIWQTHQLRLVVSPIIFHRVLYIPGGQQDFWPSTAVKGALQF